MMSRLDVIEVKGDETSVIAIRIIPDGGANAYFLEMNARGAISLTRQLMKKLRVRLLRSR